jgi:Na+/phosphate symporter
MGTAMKPLGESDVVASHIRGLENPVLGALFGAVATTLIQSSSGMMGITIKLASAGAMTVPLVNSIGGVLRSVERGTRDEVIATRQPGLRDRLRP